MGVLIIAEPAPAGTDYNKWRVYSCATKTGEYSQVGSDLALTDLTYYHTTGTSSTWYKISYYDSTGETESDLSDPMQGFSNIYTTVKKVQEYLGLASVTDSTTPNIGQIAQMIDWAEDEIDYRTGHAWRLRYSGTSSGKDNTAQYEHYPVTGSYERHSGIPVYLQHRKIRSLDADEGDALQIWTGSEWEDWLANKTEGRGNDFWLDYDLGVLYIIGSYGVRGPAKLRIKYRYGDTEVNRLVEQIATKMAVREMIIRDRRTVMLPEGNNISLSHSQMLDTLKQDIEDKLISIKEIPTIELE